MAFSGFTLHDAPQRRRQAHRITTRAHEEMELGRRPLPVREIQFAADTVLRRAPACVADNADHAMPRILSARVAEPEGTTEGAASRPQSLRETLTDQCDERRRPIVGLAKIAALEKWDAHCGQVAGRDIRAGDGEVRVLLLVTLTEDRDRAEGAILRPVVVRKLGRSGSRDHAWQLGQLVQNAAEVRRVRLNHVLVGTVGQEVSRIGAEQAMRIETCCG